MKEHKVVVDNTSGMLLIDDVLYVSHKVVKEKLDGVTHFRKVIYRKASRNEIEQSVKKIVNKIKSKTIKEELLYQLVKDSLSMKTIVEVDKQIDKGGDVKKHTGCLGFKIGKNYIQLID